MIESIFSGVLANTIYDLILKKIDDLRHPIGQHFPKDPGIDREISSFLESSIEDALNRKAKNGFVYSQRFREVTTNNIDLLVPGLVELLIFEDDRQENKILEIIASCADAPQKSKEYDLLMIENARFLKDVGERFIHRSRGSNALIGTQVRSLQRKVDRINDFLEAYNLSPGPIPVADAEFETHYCAEVRSTNSYFRHFGYPSHMRPRQDIEIAYVPLRFLSKNQVDRRTLNTDIGLYSSAQLSEMDNKSILGDIPIIAIVGSAGSGKTSLLQWITMQYVNNHVKDARIPFLVPLRKIYEFSEDGSISVDDIVKMAVDGDRFKMPSPHGYARRILSAGRAALFFDGVDEIEATHREKFWESLRDILHRFPGNRSIVTSRPLANVHLANGERVHQRTKDFEDNFPFIEANWGIPEHTLEIVVDKMSPHQISKFVGAWHESLDREVLERQMIKNDPDVFREMLDQKLSVDTEDLLSFCSTPLLCSMLCAMHFYNDGELPEDKPQLFRDSLQIMVSSRDLHRKIRYNVFLDSLSEDQRLALVQHIALNMQASFYDGQTDIMRLEVPREKVVRWIEESYKDIIGWKAAKSVSADELYNFIIERLAVVREPSSGLVDFVHRSFLEYLTAAAWPVSGRDAREIANKVTNDQWHDTLRFCANTPTGGSFFATQLLEELLEISSLDSSTPQAAIFSIASEIYSYMHPISPNATSAIFQLARQNMPPNAGTDLDFERIDYGVIKPLFTSEAISELNNEGQSIVARLAFINGDTELLRDEFMPSEADEIMAMCNWSGIPVSTHSSLRTALKERDLGERVHKLFVNSEEDLRLLPKQDDLSVNARCLEPVWSLRETPINRVNVMFCNGKSYDHEFSERFFHSNVAIYGSIISISDLNIAFSGFERLSLVGVKQLDFDEEPIFEPPSVIRLRACGKLVENLARNAFPEAEIDIERDPIRQLPY